MIVLVITSLFSIATALFESLKYLKHGLKISFAIIFIFLALRFDYGNDYLGYLDMYLDTSYVSNFNLNNFEYKGIEFGWPILNWIFYSIFGISGFAIMIAFLSAINCVVFYHLIKKYVPREFYWFAIFYYTFNYELLLIMSSAMRQSVALSIFIYGFQYVVKRNILKYLFTIFLAMTFHSSSFFLLFLYFFLSPIIKINSFSLIVVFFLITSILLFSSIAGETIFSFTDSNFNFYSGYESGEFEDRSFGLGTLLNIVILSLLFLNCLKSNNTIIYNHITKIVLVLICIIPLGIINPMFNRFNYYLVPFLLIGFTNMFKDGGQKIFNLLFIALVVLFGIYTFQVFHNSLIYGPYFKDYRTIFQFNEFRGVN